MKKRIWLIAAVICFILAMFFKFALIGYTYMAALFAGLGILILLYKLLNRFKKRKLKTILTTLLCLGTALFIAAEAPVIAASRGDEDVEADYIIVLGAGVNGTTPSLTMINRLTKANEYLIAHPETIAIVSGGKGDGEDISEAQAMYDWLIAKGIRPHRVIMEDKAASTAENLKFSYDIIGEDAQSSTVAVVSSEYHLCRAKGIASLLGYEVYTLAGKTSYPVLMINYFIREAFGMVHLWIFGI